jgi:hypothetical protein
MNKIINITVAFMLLLTCVGAQARFTQADRWQGLDRQPITLNKYVYTNADPVNHTDPSGNFGLASFGAANNIRAVLATTAIQAPRLGFTFLKSSAGHIVGIAAATCVASYAATHFGIIMPAAQFKGCEGNGHRGRWQAQGGGLQESEPWNQPMPLTLTQGLYLLDTLEAKLTPTDRRARAPFFEQARMFARRAASGGGISAANFPNSMSFPTRNQPASFPRVDLEIRAGHAFTNE